ncbi:hypothetical protein J3Q64DRAFT_1756430 [Phycomyces blakesleeanus]|uniref:GATA-type domain-containing protein n=1 Tax=Phycomyces blakesleeanus TaxID=4837 RepID=A0ABR3ASV1_PHYBL
MQKDALNPHEPSSLTTHLPFFSNLNDGPVQTSLQPPPQTLSASEPPNNHNNNNHHHHNQNTLSVTQSAVCSPPDLSFRPSSSHSQTYSLSAPLCSATLPFPLFSPTPVSPLTPSSPTCVSPVGLFINAPSHKSVARRPFINSTPSEGKIPICSNCSTTSTPLWRRSAEDDLLCNACGLYLKLHNAPRPRHLKPQSNNRPGVPENEENLIQTLCTNCRTTTTPLWRRDLKGNPLCNACGLYLKLHNEKRPLSMKTNVIKKRQRCDTGNTTSSSASVSVSVSALSSISSSPPPQKQKQKQKQPTLKNTRQQQQKQSLVSHSLPTSTPSMSTESIASISTPSTPCTTSASASASLSLSSTLSTVPNPNLHSHSHSSHIIIPNIFPAPVEFSPQAYAHQTSPVTQNFSINNHS